MVAGRPREHDRDAIAHDLIEWAKDSDSINLLGFCCSREPPLAPTKLTDWARECSRFRVAYDTAKAFIGSRRERKLNNNELHVKAYDLNAHTYDYFLREEKRNQAQFEANLKSESTPETDQDKADKEAIVDTIIAYQKRQSDLSKKSIDSKSAAVAGDTNA